MAPGPKRISSDTRKRACGLSLRPLPQGSPSGLSLRPLSQASPSGAVVRALVGRREEAGAGERKRESQQNGIWKTE